MIERLNESFARTIGRNIFGGPLYKWAFAPDLRHLRYVLGDDDWIRSDCGLWIPRPNYIEVRSYPWLGERWLIARWQFITDQEWHRAFGKLAVWPPQGAYYPTDAVMKPGCQPTQDLTDYFCQQIAKTLSIAPKEYEEHVESEMEREERFTFNTLYDMIEDECTAFGSIPGSRDGGVSFPSKETSCRLQ